MTRPAPADPTTGCPVPRGDLAWVPVRFIPSVRLSRSEAFAVCQALADAEPFLRRAGRHPEARGLGDLFELLEDRLTGPGRVQSLSGANSSESEFTQ